MKTYGSVISAVMIGLGSTIAACGSQPSFTQRAESQTTGASGTSTARGTTAQGADATAAGSAGADGNVATTAGTADGGGTVTVDNAAQVGASGAAASAGVTGGVVAGSGDGTTTAGGSAGGTTDGSAGGTTTAGGSTGGTTAGGTTGGTTTGGGTTTAGGGSTGGTTTGGTTTGGGGSTGGGGTIVIPPNCDANGATQAQLLTTSLVNNSPNMKIQYRVFRTDCQGKVIALTADKIWFDIDARVPGFSPISYTLNNGSMTQNGTMDDIVGADLFGNTGSSYAHWETDQDVDIEETTQAYVTLTIMLPQYQYVPLVGPSNQLPTFLRFGAAATVEKVIALQ